MGREMGGRFTREGLYVYLWLIYGAVWQKTTKFCKAIILQLKKKKWTITLPTKVHLVKAMVFRWELDHKESWVPKNCCFWTVVLEKTLESPLDCKEIQPVSPKGNESWIFIGRTDAEAETPILWPPDVKSRLIGKDPDAGKDWRQEEKEIGRASCRERVLARV